MNLLAIPGPADWPWYVWAVLGIVAVIVVGLVWLNWLDDDYDDAEYLIPPDAASRITNLYYHEEKALRAVLASMNIETPVVREVSKTKTRRWAIRGLGGDEGKGEKKTYEGEINFADLRDDLTEDWSKSIAQDLTIEPLSEQNTLLESLLKEEEEKETKGSKEQLALKQLIDSYGVKKEEERSRLAAKRFDNAKQASLIVMSGIFLGQVVRLGKFGAEPQLLLTKFVPNGYGIHTENDYADEIPTIEPERVPEDIRLIVKMPDKDAFTPAGQSKLRNNKEIYLTLIAHSPEYEVRADDQCFTCYAYAIWGSQLPTWRNKDWGYPGYVGVNP